MIAIFGIPYLYTKLIGQSVSNTMVPTRLNIINTLHSAVRQISKQTHQDSRLNRMGLVHTASSASTARVIIKLILPNAPSGSTALTKNSIQRSTKSFMKTEASQSAQL